MHEILILKNIYNNLNIYYNLDFKLEINVV